MSWVPTPCSFLYLKSLYRFPDSFLNRHFDYLFEFLNCQGLLAVATLFAVGEPLRFERPEPVPGCSLNVLLLISSGFPVPGQPGYHSRGFFGDLG